MKVTIQRSIEAEQWLGEHGPLPEGAHLCKPEIHWSEDRSLVYFTYAELMLPPRAEYREIDGSYGRGFRSIYMKPGDWLIKEEVPDGHDNLGYKTLRRVISDSEFQRMKRG